MRSVETTVEVKGLAELQRTLEQLPGELVRRLERRALKKAMAPGLAAARSKAPDGPPKSPPKPEAEIKNNFKLESELIAGKWLYAKVSNYANHAHLVEFGHKVVRGGSIESGGRVRKARNANRTGRGRVVGYSPPYPFMYPALQESADKMTAILVDEIQGALAALEKPSKVAA